jgi:hypothetical protein
MTFEAKFTGFCDNCDAHIYVGEEVEYFDGALIHSECARVIERPTTTCTECWTIKPCACDDEGATA